MARMVRLVCINDRDLSLSKQVCSRHCTLYKILAFLIANGAASLRKLTEVDGGARRSFLGPDFIVDATGRSWLEEVNTNSFIPDFFEAEVSGGQRWSPSAHACNERLLVTCLPHGAGKGSHEDTAAKREGKRG